jgi:hypothetical protein
MQPWREEKQQPRHPVVAQIRRENLDKPKKCPLNFGSVTILSSNKFLCPS